MRVIATNKFIKDKMMLKETMDYPNEGDILELNKDRAEFLVSKGFATFEPAITVTDVLKIYEELRDINANIKAINDRLDELKVKPKVTPRKKTVHGSEE